jgi:hypothetical protein
MSVLDARSGERRPDRRERAPLLRRDGRPLEPVFHASQLHDRIAQEIGQLEGLRVRAAAVGGRVFGHRGQPSTWGWRLVKGVAWRGLAVRGRRVSPGSRTGGHA